MFAVIKFTEKPLHKKKTILVVSTSSVHQAGLTPFFVWSFLRYRRSKSPWSYPSTQVRVSVAFSTSSSIKKYSFTYLTLLFSGNAETYVGRTLLQSRAHKNSTIMSTICFVSQGLSYVHKVERAIIQGSFAEQIRWIYLCHLGFEVPLILEWAKSAKIIHFTSELTPRYCSLDTALQILLSRAYSLDISPCILLSRDYSLETALSKYLSRDYSSENTIWRLSSNFWSHSGRLFDTVQV